MAKHTFVHVNNNVLSFERPRQDRVTHIVFAIVGFADVAMFGWIFSGLDDVPRAHLFDLVMGIILFGFFGVAIWTALYGASPLSLRFDLDRGTYEIQDGCFPVRRTEYGTTDDIQSVYVVRRRPGSVIYHHVRLRWKRRGWRWRRDSTLVQDQPLFSAEEKAREIAQKLGVPLEPTIRY